MSEQHPIARKIGKYLDDGKTNKPISKVIAHVYPEIMEMRDSGFSWAQILSVINNNQCNFKVESKTLDVTITRIKKKGAKAEKGAAKKTEKEDTKNKGGAFATIADKSKVQHDNNPDLDQLLERLKND
ncbi:hypothetical protein CAE23_19790 [Salmonella enterica]|nr:hypothetical protein [Salmonella enterica]